MRYAADLAQRIADLPEARRRRIAEFTLRCDSGCLLAMIFKRTRLTHPKSPVDNDLLVCWTRSGWRATLLKWKTNPPSQYMKDRTLPVACRHGDGLLFTNSAELFVYTNSDHYEKSILSENRSWDPTTPESEAPPGSTRRLSDVVINRAAESGTIGDSLLGNSWRPRL